MSDVTQILEEIKSGDPTAPDKLLPLVYDELKKLAAARMASEEPGQTLQATALVHEAYIKLVGNLPFRNVVPDPISDGLTSGYIDLGSVDSEVNSELNPRTWQSREHFFRAAAKAMKRILLDNARRKQAEKRGGDRRRGQMIDVASPESMAPNELLELNEALERLGQVYPRHAQLVELQFFAGVTQEEAAACLGISVATARRHWVFARAWLYGQLAETTDVKLKAVGD